jgi:hypothetical protein
MYAIFASSKVDFKVSGGFEFELGGRKKNKLKDYKMLIL